VERRTCECCREVFTPDSNEGHCPPSLIYCSRECAEADNEGETRSRCPACGELDRDDQIIDGYCRTCRSTCALCGRVEAEPEHLYESEDGPTCWCCVLQSELRSAGRRHPLDRNVQRALSVVADQKYSASATSMKLRRAS
jgi:hypothetical protein